MELRRTANAGVLLKLDGVSILLDGVCREVKSYPATPPEEKAALMKTLPDMVAFTHAHKDHYDPAYAAHYLEQGGVILGPESVKGSMSPARAGGVTVTPIPSRHIGAAGKTTPHASFLIEGTRRILFLGDSSPLLWKDSHPKSPDVLIVPYAYCTTATGWQIAKSLGAKKIVLLHMPNREADTIGLWQAVEETTKNDPMLQIPSMGQTLFFE